MSVADEYFARVRPLLGHGLSEHTISIDDGELGLLAIEMLAGCMLQKVVVTHEDTRAALARHMEWKQPFQPLCTNPAESQVRITTIRTGGNFSVDWKAAGREVTLTADPSDTLGLMDVSYHVARAIRESLLHDVPWPNGTRWHGNAAWPFSPSTAPVAYARPDYESLRGRHVMVIGCGSVGSEAIRALAGCGARWTIIDDAHVTVFNLARQWYGADEVGLCKVYALQKRVPHTRAWRTQLGAEEMPAFETMLRADPPDVVLLATGTHHHGMIGELLWRLGIPHVAACCYPQARYFEISVVSPRECTPCLHCFRGHLYRGVPDAPPIPDEVASFLYRPMADSDRSRAYTDLVAEPATRIETMRAAEILARCAVEVCARRRSPWFQRALAAGTTCLLGGNVARVLPDGSHAFGIREPGQVIRLGLDDVIGSTDTHECDVCRRSMAVVLRDELPATGDEADAALL